MVSIPNLRSSCTSAVFHTRESRLEAIFCTSMILDQRMRKWFVTGTLIDLSVPFEFYFFCKRYADGDDFSIKFCADTKENYIRMVGDFFVCLLLFPFSLFSISDVYILHCVRQTPDDDVPDDWKTAAAAVKSTND